jgi:hypothetical protein
MAHAVGEQPDTGQGDAMKPRFVIVVLDSERRSKQAALENYQPGSKKWNALSRQVAALEHAIRLVAYEAEKRSEIQEAGEWNKGMSKSVEFLSQVANSAP